MDAPGQFTQQTTGIFDGESSHIFLSAVALTDDVEGSSVIYRRFMTGNDCGGDGKTSMSRDEPCCVQEEREERMTTIEMLQMRYPSPIVASIRCIDHNAEGDVATAQIGTEIVLAPAITDNAAVTECEFRSSELIRDEMRPKSLFMTALAIKPEIAHNTATCNPPSPLDVTVTGSF